MDVTERIANEDDQKFIIDSNEALHFSLVRAPEDMEQASFFHPDMTHQVYGDSEQIIGYRSLKVKFYVTAARLNMYLDIQHDGMSESEDLEPDDIVEPLTNLLPPNTILDNKDTFLAMLKKDASFKPYGEQLHSWSINKGESSARHFEIYHCDMSTPGFLEYFERIQMFTMFFIDAASYIDTDDARWRYYLTFEKYTSSEGSPMYCVAGFTTVYEFYGYPEHVKPRISQMLVLPPFQKIGIGSAMYEAIHRKYIDDPRVLSIAMEEPSALMAQMRLLNDCRMLMELPEFEPEKLREGITDDHYSVAVNKLKINKEATKNAFNVLLLRVTDRSNPEQYKKYRLYIKNQLSSQFRRQDRDVKKLTRCMPMSREQILEACMYVPVEKRPEKLQREFLELECLHMDYVSKLPSYAAAT